MYIASLRQSNESSLLHNNRYKFKRSDYVHTVSVPVRRQFFVCGNQIPSTPRSQLHIVKVVSSFSVKYYASFEFFTIRFSVRLSVRLSDRSKVTQNKINFVKNCPQWGLNSQPPDHQSTALPTVLSHYLVVCVNH